MRIGSRISHYEILERLRAAGKGKLSEVYKARDLRHDRNDRLVALGLFSPLHGLSAEDRRRFLSGDWAADALSHPGIRPIDEIGETREGRFFLAMAFRPGETLADLRTELLAAVDSFFEDAESTHVDGSGHRLRFSLGAVLTGRRVAQYRIGEPLGGGGMGVLYRAEDTRLGRTIALKFLAPELGRDPVAKTRFLTEARAASALEHPNICTILDAGETEDGLLFLAMPLYEGESLEHRLARGPLPVAQALDIATQTANGLAKAHRHGIVHRDVKPANLFLTEDGTVKILDFGIAKIRGEVGPTLRGGFLGTPSYMAPEQTRGEDVDARADVWSLGVVLYEMLAGQRPFAGSNGTAILYAVVHREPEPLPHGADAPEEIERIVSRLLTKDREQRYANAGEVLVDLRQAQGLATTSTNLMRPRATRPWWRSAPAIGIVLALASTLGVAAFLARRGANDVPGPQPTNFRRLTDFQGKETFPSLSPDGKSFLYARSAEGKWHIFSQRVAGGNSINLTAGSGFDNTQPAYSPDGERIAFRSERDGGGIFLMGATGESPRRLTDFGFNPAWSPDGRKIVVATEGPVDPAQRLSLSQLFLVDVATQVHQSLGVIDGAQPSWSPHGWRIAFWGISQPGARRAIWTIPSAGGKTVTVIDDAYYNWNPVWSPDGKYLYFASNRGGSMNFWRTAIDERSGAALANPEPITTPSAWSALPSFSRDGRLLLYATNDDHSFVEQVPFDPDSGRIIGSPSLVRQAAGAIWSCDLSPDDRWLAFWAGSPQDDLFLIRPDGSDLRQLTNDPERDRAPRWSPDGSRILFYSNRSGKYEAWTIQPDGRGLTQVTNLPAHDVYNPSWSPDGRQIGFTYKPSGVAIMDLSRPSGVRVLPPLEGLKGLGHVSWSPDRQFLGGILLRPDESPEPGIGLWSLADHTYRRLTRTGDDPVFFHRRPRILFTDLDAIRFVDTVTGEVRTLLSPPPHSFYVSASVGQSDRRLCTVRSTDEGDVWILSLVEPASRH